MSWMVIVQSPRCECACSSASPSMNTTTPGGKDQITFKIRSSLGEDLRLRPHVPTVRRMPPSGVHEFDRSYIRGAKPFIERTCRRIGLHDPEIDPCIRANAAQP